MPLYIDAFNETVGEADGFAMVAFVLSAASPTAVSVRYATADGTAASGTHYTRTTGTLEFAPGETVKTVRIPIMDDGLAVRARLFYLELSSPVDATLSRTSIPVTIIDNDAAAGTPIISVLGISVDETSGFARFVVTLDRPSRSVVSVSYATADDSAVAGLDYLPVRGSLVFAPGETAKMVLVPLVNDLQAEISESFSLLLGVPTGAMLGHALGQALILANDAPVVERPVIDAFDAVVGESDGFVDITFFLSAPSASPVSFRCRTDSAALSAYTSAGLVTFAPGETSKTIRLGISDNTTANGNRLFNLELSSAVDATLARTSIPVSIIDNDASAGLPTVSVSGLTVDESAPFARFVVTLDRPGRVAGTVAYATGDLSAVAGQDYLATSGTLLFLPGEITKTILVPLVNDSLAETAERFSLTLSAPLGLSLGHTIAHAELPANDGPVTTTPFVRVGAVTVDRAGGYADIPLWLDNPSASIVTVGYGTANGSADLSDYSLARGTLSFSPGEVSKTLRIAINHDEVYRSTGLFHLNLTAQGGAILETTSVPITIAANDRPRGLPTVSVGHIHVDESDALARFVITLDRPSSESVTLSYATADESAVAGQDYTRISGTLVFLPGEVSKTVLVPLTNDLLPESQERFALILGSPSGALLGNAVAYADLSESDTARAATPNIRTLDAVVGETDGSVTIPILLSAPSAVPVSVKFSTTQGLSYQGEYAPTSGVLTFAPGETLKTIRIGIIDDGSVESTRLFYLSLTSPVGATLERGHIPIAIIDNDAPAAAQPVAFISGAQVDESGSFAQFVVSLNRPSLSTTSVAYATSDGTAIEGLDYTRVSGTLSFAPGEVIKTVKVPIINDSEAEGAETFELVLTSPLGLALGLARAQARIGLSDQPVMVRPLVQAGHAVANESEGRIEFPITLSSPATATVVVSYELTNGTAVGGLFNSDFKLITGTVAFEPGQTRATVTVALLPDAVAERLEYFSLLLSSPQNADLGVSVGLGVILDGNQAAGALALRTEDVVVSESDGTVAVTVYLNSPSTTPTVVSVSTQDGTARLGRDYVRVAEQLVVIPAGSLSATVSLELVDDQVPEGGEYFDLVFTPVGGSTGPSTTARVFLAASDLPVDGSPVVSVRGTTVREGDRAAVVVVSLSQPSASVVRVSYTAQADTATNGDFMPQTGQIAFAPGETIKTLHIGIADDTAAEATERFTIRLSNPLGGTLGPESVAIVSIIDNDTSNADSSAPQVSLVSALPRPFGDISRASVTVLFDETLMLGSTGRIMAVDPSTGAVLEVFAQNGQASANLALSGKVMTLYPSFDLGVNTGQYRVVIEAGSVRDAAGQALSSAQQLSVAYGALSSYAVSVGERLLSSSLPDILTGAGGNDLIIGNGGADTIRGLAGHDTLRGGQGNDLLTGGAGDDLLDGSDGLDTAVYAGTTADYRLNLMPGGYIQVRDIRGQEGTDSLSSVERLQFANRSIITETRAHGSFSDLPASMYQFFILAFDAAPGVEYLQQCADAYRAGASVKLITQVFTSKSQFTDVYPTTMSNRELATKLIANVVGNSAASATKAQAIEDITAAMNNGLSLGSMIFTVFTNLAAKPLTGDEWSGTARLFKNQIAVARYYTEVLDQGTTDLATLRAALDAVGPDSNVDSDQAIATLIGLGLMGGAPGG